MYKEGHKEKKKLAETKTKQNKRERKTQKKNNLKNLLFMITKLRYLQRNNR